MKQKREGAKGERKDEVGGKREAGCRKREDGAGGKSEEVRERAGRTNMVPSVTDAMIADLFL